MTDQTPDIATAEDVFASLRAGRTSHPATTVRVTDAYDGQRASVSTPGAVLEAGDDEVLGHQRADNGTSLSGALNDVSAITGRLNFLNGKLAEGAHDPKTGEFKPAVPASLRAAFKIEAASLAEELAVAHRTVEAVRARQARAQEVERVRVENDAAEFEFTQGDRERAEALRKAKLELEAKQVAEWLLRRQYSIG